MRTAVVQALAAFHQVQAVLAALVQALHTDHGYAVQVAAAKGLDQSGMPRAFPYCGLTQRQELTYTSCRTYSPG